LTTPYYHVNILTYYHEDKTNYFNIVFNHVRGFFLCPSYLSLKRARGRAENPYLIHNS